MTDPTPMPTDRASVSDLLEAAVRLWRVTLPKCLPLAMAAIVCLQAANIYWLAGGHTVPVRGMPDNATYRVLLVAGSLAYLLLLCALVLRQRAVATGGAAQLVPELAFALRRLGVLVLALLLTACAVLAGFILLLVPGIFLMFCFVILVPVVMFERCGPVDAVLRCVRLVRPFWWKICAAVVIGCLVVLVCAIVLAAILGLAALLAGGQPAAFQAIATAIQVGAVAIAAVFFNALWIVLYSAASSSA